jgi:hypothetical protein
MLSKCANPSCSDTFRYWHEGRMFHLIVDSGKTAAGHGAAVIERFWLCDECSKKWTLVPCQGDGQVPIHVEVITSRGHRVADWVEKGGALTEERRLVTCVQQPILRDRSGSTIDACRTP